MPGSDKAGVLERLRLGDDTAFGELFAEHEAAVRRLARGLVSDTAEADDVTAETFFRVLQAVRRGNGPRDNVRAYLMTVARRVAWEWQGSRRDVPVTDEELTSRAGAGTDWQASTAEAALITRAFSTLPERWRTVLWQTEVEGEQPAMVAPHFGLSANATAALARRARIGLRAAYLQAHLTTDRSSHGCRGVRERLGAYTAGTVAGAEARKITHHLGGCSSCRSTHDELRQVCSALRTHASVLVALVPLSGAALAGAAAAGAGSAGGATVGGATAGGASLTGLSAGGAAAGGVEVGTSVAVAVGVQSKIGLALASTAAAVTVVSGPVLGDLQRDGGTERGTGDGDHVVAQQTTDTVLIREQAGSVDTAPGSAARGGTTLLEATSVPLSDANRTSARSTGAAPDSAELPPSTSVPRESSNGPDGLAPPGSSAKRPGVDAPPSNVGPPDGVAGVPGGVPRNDRASEGSRSAPPNGTPPARSPNRMNNEGVGPAPGSPGRGSGADRGGRPDEGGGPGRGGPTATASEASGRDIGATKPSDDRATGTHPRGTGAGTSSEHTSVVPPSKGADSAGAPGGTRSGEPSRSSGTGPPSTGTGAGSPSA